MADVLIVGVGFLGTQIAKDAIRDGWRVWGTTRSKSRCPELESLGMRPLALGDGLGWDALPDSVSLVVTAPPSTDSASTRIETVLNERLENVAVSHVTYVSSTGVYTEQMGGVVCESSPLSDAPRAARRLGAERDFAEWTRARKATFTVLRAAAIYSAQRGLRSRLEQGIAKLWGGGGQLLNRVHVEDLSAFALESLSRRVEGTFNVADGNPATLAEQIAWLCDQFGYPTPPKTEEIPSSTLAGSKRVEIAKLRAEFQHEFLYPDFRSGYL